MHRGPLEWHYLRAKFYEIYQAVLKLLVGGHADIVSRLNRYVRIVITVVYSMVLFSYLFIHCQNN
jgi:hypothetical protein